MSYKLIYKNNLQIESETDIGVFEELPKLLGRIVDDTCQLLCDDLVLEIKAASRDYRCQKYNSSIKTCIYNYFMQKIIVQFLS